MTWVDCKHQVEGRKNTVRQLLQELIAWQGKYSPIRVGVGHAQVPEKECALSHR